MYAYTISSIGIDSHRFASENEKRPLILGGVTISTDGGLDGNSDADVVLHALTNAVSGIHGVPVLGAISDQLCLEDGITDSRVYLAKSLSLLADDWELLHVSFVLEALKPKLTPHFEAMRASIGAILNLSSNSVTFTATTGEQLTGCGCGEGIQATCILTTGRKTEQFD